nr:oligopeptide transporter 2-like [Ipomoea batatas]
MALGKRDLEAPQNEAIAEEEEEDSPVEQVRLTVSTHDDPSLPVWTFRMWSLGLLSCALLSFVNTFFGYRTEPLIITMISIQVVTLPIGRFMAKVLPERTFRLGSWEFSLNPGPFNMKEHVLISIFANAGSDFGNGTAYAVSIVDIIKAFYMRNISFLTGWILVTCTQLLGYGWAGMMRKYVIDPAEMWWPTSLVQVSLFRALHEKDENRNAISRSKFFFVALVCSMVWYVVPGFLFPTISNLSLLCLLYPKSVLVQQIGSGMKGLGILSFTFDWSVVASYLFSPLITPFFAIANIFVGYVAIVYVLIPISYWGFNLYDAKNFPLFSSHLFTSQGQPYNVSAIVNDRFELDTVAYAQQGRVNLSTFFALSCYGLSFASVVSILTHQPGLNVITEYIIGLIMPGKPIANVCFKTFGYISMSQAVSFLTDFKLGHYMKIPPRSMFMVQIVGTFLAGTVNMAVAWWLLTTIPNICQDTLLPPDSPWTCPGDRVFYDASVIWGLLGPRRIFGSMGRYSAINWFFLGGALAPVLVWLAHRAFPKQRWIRLINLPVLLGATATMPPATTLNFNSWLLVGTIFNFFIFRYRKNWWRRYNYVLSAALEAGLAFMAVILYFGFGMRNVSVDWWGSRGEHCDLASCPTAPGIQVDGCPVF